MPLADEPENAAIPAHLDRWNWGAFFLNWIWGLGNSTFIALLMFIPFVNIIMLFVLGAKGSKWAWKNRIWLDEDHFVRTQRKWARAGLAVFLGFPVFIVLLYVGISSSTRNSVPYVSAMEMVRDDSAVMNTLGSRISEGYLISSQFTYSGSDGSAKITIPVSGPLCNGDVYVRADKSGGVWETYLLVVMSDCQTAPVILINTNNLHIPDSSRAVDQKNI